MIAKQTLLYTGREWLAELDLYDYRNRFYSTTLGRFLQTDPIRFDGGDVNLYRYVGNSAINFKDPFGEVAIPTVIAAILGIEALLHNLCSNFAEKASRHAKTDSEKHCLVSCNYARCVGIVNGFIGGAIQSLIGGIMQEGIQFLTAGNSWKSAVADIRSNITGIVGGLNPFQSCEDACKSCKGKWNP